MKQPSIIRRYLSVFACLTTAPLALGQSPAYFNHFTDVTIKTSRFFHSGAHHWSVPQGADHYASDQYERPTNQSYKYFGGIFSTEGNYYGNLDIEKGSFGYDSTYIYVQIKMVDTMFHERSGTSKNEGLIYDYRFRLNLGPSGAGGYLFTTDQPGTKGTGFRPEKNFGYRDSNSDADRKGNGYETRFISDGKLVSNGKAVFFTRVNPSDPSILEFALDYVSMGMNPAIISNIVFEANKGLKDPSRYPWNPTYTASEAGSPNGGANGRSEFGTPGLMNVYELDTLNGVISGQATSSTPPAQPPTGKLTIPRDIELRGTRIPIGYSIVR
jgi:hypothetical protein